MRRRASAALALTLATPLAAEPPGAVQTHAESRARQAVAAPMRPWSPDAPGVEVVEGAVDWAAWRLPDGATSLSAAREEQARREAEGWRTVLFCGGEDCGGFDFRAGLDVLPPPAMRLDLFDFHALTMRRDADVLTALASGGAGGVWLQRAVIEPAAAAPAVGDAPAPPEDEAAPDPPPLPSLDPPQPAAPPPQPAAAGDAAALLAALERDGRVVLEGVAFAVGSTDLEGASDAVLDAAVEALGARPGLSVVVVGHTDDTGDLALNQRVSASRARSVLEALARRGVARSRLDAAGAGWLAPRASNATPEGQAANRRVELVAR